MAGDKYFGQDGLGNIHGNIHREGVDGEETAEQTMFRELYEEVGLKPEHVKIVASTKHWLKYKLPKRYIRHDSKPVCIGQKQKWFLLKLTAPESSVDLLNSSHPEFDDWRWVSYWYPVRQVVSFKRDVYRKVMKEFASQALAFSYENVLTDDPLDVNVQLNYYYELDPKAYLMWAFLSFL